MNKFDKLFDWSPYLAILCVFVGLYTIIAFPVMWFVVGILTNKWTVPAYFILGFPAIGFVIGNLSYILYRMEK